MNKLLVVILFVLGISVHCGAQTDIDVIRERIVKELLKSTVEDSKVISLIGSIKEDGTWPGIDYTNVSSEGFEHRYHLGNMLILARAYASESSGYYKNKQLKTTLEVALKNWVENDYFCENWWHNQIGTPGNLVILMLLVGDELNMDLVIKAQPIIGRAHTEAGGARPGGDRIKIAGIQAKNCLFLGEDEKFNEVVRIIEGEIKSSEWVGAKYGYGFRYIPTGFSNREMGGRGIQYDNSFHHRVDGVNNTLSYGLGYAAAFAEWAVYTNNTKFAFSQEKLAPLIDYFLDGICKTAVFGKYPDPGAKNRSISREGALKAYSSALPEKLLSVSDYRKDELQEIVEIRRNKAKPTLSHATYYWHSEHFSVQRPDWFTSVRMYSTRNHNMEKPYNSEGFFNHHRGDGANHISVKGDEYADMAPVMDYQKIPGTTVMQKPEMPGAGELLKLGLTDFVGAATDGYYGIAAFDFKSPHDPLIARKSWFFFDDMYVCLGSGISCKAKEMPVVTAINQCLQRGDVHVFSENKLKLIERGEAEYLHVDWIFHDGVGYFFPQSRTVHIKNDKVSGSWWRINQQTDSPKDEIELDIFEAWIVHGKRASEEEYEYIVLPATTLENMNKVLGKGKPVILENSPEIQAVKNADLDIFQAVFYKAGEIQLSDNLKLKCESPGIVMVQTANEGGIKITVSDPNRELAKIVLTLSVKWNKGGENFKATWDEEKQQTELIIDLPGKHSAGKSVTIQL